MPFYTYSHPKTKETIDVFQGMNDEHVYVKNGVKWNRVWSSPEASFDTKWDANNSNDFVEKTRRKKGTLGDLFDKSKELGEKRGDDGTKRWSKMRGGREHPDNMKKQAQEFARKRGINIEF